jgi:sugar lactone lactonase YvrE
MKTRIKYIVITIITVVVVSCSKDDNTFQGPDPIQEQQETEVLVPYIDELNPKHGPRESVVTITGVNFGTDLTKLQVYFNESEARVISLSDDMITATVPNKAGSGTVKVIAGGNEAVGPHFTYYSTGLVKTFAGSENGFADGNKDEAMFRNPMGMAMDNEGNIYIADADNHKIRKISTDGVVSTLAGSKEGYLDGPTDKALFNSPHGIATDNMGNVYVADMGNHSIRKITSFGVVTTVAGNGVPGNADGPGSMAQFNSPIGITIDKENNVYVADYYNDRIRKILPNGEVTTYAGSKYGYEDGPANSAKFAYPASIAIDSTGNLYVADSDNDKIRKIAADGIVSTLDAGGPTENDGPTQNFRNPHGISIDAHGNIYIADTYNNVVKKVYPNGELVVLAGSTAGSKDGTGTEAQFYLPFCFVFDTEGNVFVSDSRNDRIRKIVQE